jgi:HD-GYP domain-containing protein (c-di-GMP phosphodiesterase class II)
MLGSISRALEERDHTQGHGARVAALAEPVARRLGWDDKRIAGLCFGAPLHDIGKLAVRCELLRKAGPLSLEERAEIEVHPTAGAAFIAPLPQGSEVLPYVLYHHERWDGAGYPFGLRRGSIPVEVRLLAVADAFDAMTSARSYRTALTTDSALAEIALCSGSQFDPALAETFFDVWAEAGSLPAAVAS